MWGMFAAAVLLGAAFLYVPGYFMMRALRFSRIPSFACAPLLSVVLYGVMTVAYGKLGVFCDWVALAVPALIIGVAAFVVSQMLTTRFSWRGVSSSLGSRSGSVFGMRADRFDLLCLIAYIVVGAIAVGVVLLANLEAPDSVLQEYDNIHHLGQIHAFVSSGVWSPLSVTLFPGADAAVSTLPGSGFYPSAWHWVASFMVSSLGVSVPLSVNAVDALFAGFVYPASMFLLMRVMLAKHPGAVALGAFVAPAFTAFPWGFLIFGPLYANLASFSMMPAAAYLFISLFDRDASASSRVRIVAVFAAFVVAMALAQPNAVFTMGAMLIAFCVWKATGLTACIPWLKEKGLLGKVVVGVLATVFFAGVWYVLFKLPFLQGVVTHEWAAFTTRGRAFVDALSLSFRVGAPQVLLAVLLAVGSLWTLRHRDCLWIAFSYAFFCAIYIVDVTSGGPLEFLLSGFWYTDSWRVAASAVFSGVPLASLGLALAAKGAARGVRGLLAAASAGGSPSGDRRNRAVALASSCVVAVAFAFLCFMPGVSGSDGSVLRNGLNVVEDSIRVRNSSAGVQVYDAAERAFVDEVERVVPEGSYIVNVPDDGSAFAYGIDGLNVLYRSTRTYDVESESPEGYILRTRLADAAADADVRSALESVGADYVLVLDDERVASDRAYLFTYDPALWQGILSIDADTPGFELVLSEGDMRLYRITAAA